MHANVFVRAECQNKHIFTNTFINAPFKIIFEILNLKKTPHVSKEINNLEINF